jgi:hypothetical protein
MVDRDTKKIDTKSEKIWITQIQQRHGYDTLVTMLVPNPNLGGKKNKRKRRED